MPGDKATKNIGVWLTEAELAELDQRIAAAQAEAAQAAPGARVSRSGYVAEIVRAHLRQDSAR